MNSCINTGGFYMASSKKEEKPKTITIGKDVWRDLANIKMDNDLASYTETLRMVLKKYHSTEDE